MSLKYVSLFARLPQATLAHSDFLLLFRKDLPVTAHPYPPKKTSLEQLLWLCLVGVTPEISPVGSKSSPNWGVIAWCLLTVQNYNSTMNICNCLEHRPQWVSGMLPRSPRKIGSGEKVVKATLKNSGERWELWSVSPGHPHFGTFLLGS